MWHLRDECLDYMEQYLVLSYNKYWVPSQRICLDESMRKFKGRSKHKVYQPKKPIRRGLKYYVAVDDRNYCIFFTMYKSGSTIPQKTRVLYNKIMDILPMTGYLLYCDNYYGSLETAHDALNKGFGFTFACRSNRPSDIFEHFLHHHFKQHKGISNIAFLIKEDNTMGVISWKDRNIVNFVSNIYLNTVVEVSERQNGVKRKRKVPEVRHDYNLYGMGLVDTFNSHLSRYDFVHRNISWRRTHLLTMLKITIVNSWTLYKNLNPGTHNCNHLQDYLFELKEECMNYYKEETKRQMEAKKRENNRKRQQKFRCRQKREGN